LCFGFGAAVAWFTAATAASFDCASKVTPTATTAASWLLNVWAAEATAGELSGSPETDATATCGARFGCAGGAEITTAPPAVATAAASSVATWPEPTTIAPEANRPLPPAAPPAATTPPPAVAPPAPVAVAPLLAPAPPETPSVFARKPIGPSGTSAASRRLTLRSSRLKLRHPEQSRMWRLAVALGRTPRSWAPTSSSLMSQQAVSRATAA
jgi:hypothetical protein